MNEEILLPLEILKTKPLSEYLNGAMGINRDKTNSCLITANNDMAAIECWLAEYAKSSATQRNYKKDAERLLLWAIIEKQKALSSLNGNDLLEYSKFLDDPQPKERWCGPKKARNGRRFTEGWRPFVGNLSLGAKATTFANLKSLFNYLTDVRYLAHNPFLSIRRQVKQHSHGQLDQQAHRVANRIIDLDEWWAIQDILDNLPDTKGEEKLEKARLRFLIALFYFAGLRNNEMISHTMAAFKKNRDIVNGIDRWWLYINRKGDKLKKIPVNQLLLEALIEYRRCLGLSDLPESIEQEPLIRALTLNHSITSRRVNQLIKQITFQAAEKFVGSNPEKAERLRKFSAHWLRHLSFSMQGLVGISKQNIKENAGHENDSTTEVYLHAFDNQRHDEIEKLTWKPDFMLNTENIAKND